MTTYGLIDSGLRAPTSAEVLADLRADVEAALDEAGLPSDIDYERDTIAGILTTALALRLGALWQAVQGVYDGTDPAAAVNVALDNLGALRGIARRGATFSTATVSLTGTSGTVIPAGELILEGGGTDDRARWTTTETVTISGSTDVAVRASERGAIAASIGAIDKIVTPIDGLDTASNAAAATTGDERETDAEYRSRQARSIGYAGGRAASTLRARLLELDYINGAVIVENRTDTSITVGAKTIDPHSLLTIIDPGGLTSAQEQEIAETIYNWGPAGVKFAGSDHLLVIAAPSPVAEYASPVRWDDVDLVSIPLVTTITAEASYVTAELADEVKAAQTALVESLQIGEPLRLIDMQRVTAIEGVASASITIDGSAADRVIARYERITISSISVS